MRVVLVVGHDLGAAGSHARPTTKTSPFGVPASASTVSRSGATDHSSSQLARQRLDRLLADLDRAAAPSAQRPAQEASQAARRPASQRPSASRTTHSTETLRVACVGDEAQRPARRLQLEVQPVVVLLEVGQPRGEPVVARRAALAQRRERRVGGGRVGGGRLERLARASAR